jgi:hypothetical protein
MRPLIILPAGTFDVALVIPCTAPESGVRLSDGLAWWWVLRLSSGTQGLQFSRKTAPPRHPIVRLPTLGHALVVVVGDIEVGEMNSSAASLLHEYQDERGIGITLLERRRSPGLDNQRRLDHGQHRPVERTIERPEPRACLLRDDYRRTGYGRVPGGIKICFEESFGRRVQVHDLPDDASHGVRPFAFSVRTIARSCNSPGEVCEEFRSSVDAWRPLASPLPLKSNNHGLSFTEAGSNVQLAPSTFRAAARSSFCCTRGAVG